MNRQTAPTRVAITGGPGAGKTSLLEGLRIRGYPVVPEVAREIIAERKSKGLSPRPSAVQFAQMIMDRDIQQYDSTPPEANLVFFDRSLLDSLSMMSRLNN